MDASQSSARADTTTSSTAKKSQDPDTGEFRLKRVRRDLVFAMQTQLAQHVRDLEPDEDQPLLRAKSLSCGLVNALAAFVAKGAYSPQSLLDLAATGLGANASRESGDDQVIAEFLSALLDEHSEARR